MFGRPMPVRFLLGCLFCSALLLTGLRSFAAEETVPTATNARPMSAEVQVDEIFRGGIPRDLSELRAMERRQQALVQDVIPVTVAIQAGPAQGSGVIVSPEGYVLTAAHVVHQAKRRGTRIVITTSDGKRVLAKPLGLNRSMDAGLVKITQTDADGKPRQWPHAEMAKDRQITPGQWCLVTGHPGGYQRDRKPVVRIGRISSVTDDVLVTDCTLIGGDSGGPIFDMDGKVIGVNSRIAKKLTTNMHVPVAVYHEDWSRLTQGDVWGRFPNGAPYIGVRGDGDADVAKIVEVVPGAAADEAGLEEGDVITAFDGEDVGDFQSLVDLVRETAPGERVMLRVRRGKREFVMPLEIGRLQR